MAAEVEIEALRRFNRNPQGGLCGLGDRFSVAVSRAEELERLGLARRVAVAPPVTTQALPDPNMSEAPRRRGRPRKAEG